MEKQSGRQQGSRKQITFDLSQKALEAHYPRPDGTENPTFYKKAYADIARFMVSHGFEHRQFSVYTSTGKLTAIKVIAVMRLLVEAMPWLAKCVNQIDVTNIGVQHSLMDIVDGAAKDLDIIKSRDDHVHSDRSSSPKMSVLGRLKEAKETLDYGDDDMSQLKRKPPKSHER